MSCFLQVGADRAVRDEPRMNSAARKAAQRSILHTGEWAK
jgi:hypothetical protein